MGGSYPSPSPTLTVGPFLSLGLLADNSLGILRVSRGVDCGGSYMQLGRRMETGGVSKGMGNSVKQKEGG